MVRGHQQFRFPLLQTWPSQQTVLQLLCPPQTVNTPPRYHNQLRSWTASRAVCLRRCRSGSTVCVMPCGTACLQHKTFLISLIVRIPGQCMQPLVLVPSPPFTMLPTQLHEAVAPARTSRMYVCMYDYTAVSKRTLTPPTTRTVCILPWPMFTRCTSRWGRHAGSGLPGGAEPLAAAAHTGYL